MLKTKVLAPAYTFYTISLWNTKILLSSKQGDCFLRTRHRTLCAWSNGNATHERNNVTHERTNEQCCSYVVMELCTQKKIWESFG